MQLDKRSNKIKDLDNKSFAVGEVIFAKNFNINSSKKWLPGEIIEVLGMKNYKVKVYDAGQFIWKRHCIQLKPRCLPI